MNMKFLDQEYKVNDAKYQSVRKKVQQLKKLLKFSKEQAEKIKDPKYAIMKSKQIFQQYLEILDPSDFTSNLPQDPQSRHYMVIGDISAGKSSMINFFFLRQEEVGVGETTSVIKKIPAYNIPHTNKTIYIWDTPGKNEEFNVSNFEYLRLFSSADKIFILNKKRPEDIKEMLLVLNKLKPNHLYYVRTQMNSGLQPMTQAQIKNIEKKDKNFLFGLGIYNIPIFQIAVDYGNVKVKMTEYDNLKLKKELHQWIEK